MTSDLAQAAAAPNPEPPNELAQLRALQAQVIKRRVEDESANDVLSLAACVCDAPYAFLMLTDDAIKMSGKASDSMLSATSFAPTTQIGFARSAPVPPQSRGARVENAPDSLQLYAQFGTDSERLAAAQTGQDPEDDWGAGLEPAADLSPATPAGVSLSAAPAAAPPGDVQLELKLSELVLAHFGASFFVADAASDARFDGFDLRVDGVPMRAYASAPLVTAQGTVLGALCVINPVPQAFSDANMNALRMLARQAVSERELRLAILQLKLAAEDGQRYQQQLEESQELLEVANHTLAALNVIDLLTGVHNRRAFDDLYATEHSRARRDSKPLSVVMVEIDGLAAHQEEFGRSSGDTLLKTVAQLLRCNARPYDVLARFDTNRFVLVLPGTPSTYALTAAERWRKAIAAHAWEEGSVSVSMGVASSESAQIDEDLVFAADSALFAAQAKGGNHTVHVNALGR
jgi:diguanylate cyclase (GGDEF)-like protein